MFKNLPQKRSVLVLTLTFFCAGCLTTQFPKIEIKSGSENNLLKWNSIVQEALQKNPDILSARFSITSAARTRDIAAGDYLPSVSGQLQRDIGRTTITPTKDNMGLDLIGEESLFTGFDTTGKFIKARKDLEVARWNYWDTSANVRFRIRAVYIELLRLRKLSGVQQEIEKRRKQNAQLIRLRYEAGREHLGSALRAEAIAGQSDFQIRQTSRTIDTESLRLGRELGGDFQLPVQVDGDLEKLLPKLPETKPDYAALAEQIPKVKKALKMAESYKAVLISAQAAVWPKVDGVADYGYAGTRATNLRDDASAGLKITLPFFNGGKNVGAIRKAKADYDAAREAARSIRDEIFTQLTEAWTAYYNAVEAVVVSRKFLEAAQKRSEIVKAEYEAGLDNYQDFDIAEQDIADSETNYVQSLANALTQKANWELVKGSTLEDALREV